MCLAGLEPVTYRLKADYATNCVTDTEQGSSSSSKLLSIILLIRIRGENHIQIIIFNRNRDNLFSIIGI